MGRIGRGKKEGERRRERREEGRKGGRKGDPVSNMGKKRLQVISYDDKVEVFSEKMKKNLMIEYMSEANL